MENLGEATQECHQPFIVFRNQLLPYILNMTVIGNKGVEADRCQWLC